MLYLNANTICAQCRDKSACGEFLNDKPPDNAFPGMGIYYVNDKNEISE